MLSQDLQLVFEGSSRSVCSSDLVTEIYVLVIMVRKLKFHEQKLLKKVDFISWEVDNNLHEIKIMRKYNIQKREDYTKCKKLAREIREVVSKVKDLDNKDPFRVDCSASILEKLYVLGVIPNKSDLALCDKVTASNFCRRRLPFIVVRSKMVQGLSMATKLVEQGHIRVGPDVIKDPAFLVSRNLEDFVTWVDTSKFRQHVLVYNDMRDDFIAA
ncbi:hypothetical protein J437_LFUL017793 [Ladona fulva]|uniref:U3 small nucleolar ribonucleoprotein protein IMP3 n=1 Tax=Ladona fulva TaxID=123851 RepID=A0A8K0KPD4_LADFU|nr:hypothetical protein J437_LFUL017793 [Ladona fulva]